MAMEDKRSDPILAALTAPMSMKPRQAVMRRHEAMLGELRFLSERESPDENLSFIRRHKWSDERLSALFALNSVYQEVLGPLHASTRVGAAGLGTEYPIRHGSQRFDASHNVRVQNAIDDFYAIVERLGFLKEWMTRNTCGDLVYYIARFERDSDSNQ